MEELKDFLMELLQIAITGAVPILTAYLVSFLKTKKTEVADKIDNEYVATQLERVSDIIASVVTKVSQTYVDALKKDKSFTLEAQTIAFETAKAEAINLINGEAVELITDIYGSFEDYLETKIEEMVAILKK